MRSKIKKILVVGLLLVVLMMMFTGCGNNKDKKVESKVSEVKEEVLSASKNGDFVEYKGDLYYWKLSEKSREDEAIFASYNNKDAIKNSLVKRNSDGNETVLLTDNGASEIFIVNGRIYTTNFWKKDSNVYQNIFSIDLNGENKKEYKSGIIKFVIGDYLICESTSESSTELYRINTKNDEIETLKKGVTALCNVGDTVFYSDKPSRKSETEISIGSVTGNVDNGFNVNYKAGDLFDEDLYTANFPVEVVDSYVKDNQFIAYFVFRAGTLNSIQNITMLTMNIDGTNAKLSKQFDNMDELSMDQMNSTDEVYQIYNNKTSKQEVWYYNREKDERNSLMELSQLEEELGFESGDEYLTTICSSNVIGDNLYLVVDNSKHSSKNDIGWRYSYKRLKTKCIKIDVKTKEMSVLYEF